MRFSDRPRPAQLYVVSVCGLALTLSAFAAFAASNGSLGGSPQLFALLVAAATIAHSFPVSTPTKQSYHVSLPFFVAAIIVLSPLQFVALVGVVHIAESLRIRRSNFAQIFNVATYVLTGLVAQAVYRTLWPGQGELTADLSQPACLAAGLAAAATFVALNRALVSAAIWLANGISPSSQHMFELEGVLTDTVLLLMGLPLAHLMLIAPWAAAVGAAPLWLIHRVLDLPNIRAQSRQDGLTELFTAPYLTETCTRELNRGRRFNRPVSLLLLDVDALGELNAAHGHQTGDMVLRATARTISRSLREYDLAARLAGGLFAVLLPETDLAQAQIVAERIRRSTAELPHEVPGSVEQVRVTLSVGAVVVNGQNATATQLFEAAQAALAMAKRDGGNEVAFQPVQAPTLQAIAAAPSEAVPEQPRGVRRPDSREPAAPRPVFALLRTLALLAVAAISFGMGLVAVAEGLDVQLLAVLLCVSSLAGLAFYFKSLPLAVALAGELQRSSSLTVPRYWRMWPRYVALSMGASLAIYAYARVGLLGAMLMISFALLTRHVAGRYVDRTFESVRKLRTANEALEHRAFHDPLTNLPNRSLFAERLEHAMVRAGEGSVAVLFVDLDNFKSVNDSLGHAGGDALLIATTKRLVDCVRREDTIARLGGDEFTVLLEDMRDPSDAARMAERIGEALATPFTILGQQVSVSSSIGIALDTDRSHSPDDLLREADLAMYRAKSAGKARYEIFDTNMAEQAAERLGLETDLREAVALGQLDLHYEPVTNLDDDGTPAFAGLLRWRHPRLGLLESGEFMRVAEETGAVLELGRWMLEQACRDARAWQHSSPGVPLHLSLSARQLEHPGFGASVASALAAADLPPELLHLTVDGNALGSEQCCAAAAEVVSIGAHVSVLAGNLHMNVATLQPDRERRALRAA
jgi:diguanylate cyclase (GGDEF)-like protein